MKVASMNVIVKEGTVYLHWVKFLKRVWRKIWMVLYKPNSTGVGRLELYTHNPFSEQKKSIWQKTPEKKVVRLSDCLSITSALTESCPPGCTAFCLTTTQCNFVLASTESKQWLSVLCLLTSQKDPGESDLGGFERRSGLTMEDNDLSQYRVTVQSTEASRRCQLAGEYLVSPEKQAVLLLVIGTGHVIYHWPYRLIRKFGQVQGGFIIEAGRRCESGEGVFIFLSQHGPQIFQTILKQCSVKRPMVNLPASTNQHAAGVFESAERYCTFNDTPPLNVRKLSLVRPHSSNTKKALREEAEENCELCHSTEGVNLEDVYCTPRGTADPRQVPFRQKMDRSECIQPNGSPLNPQPEPFTSPLPQFLPLPLPCTLPQSILFALPGRNQCHPVNNCFHPGHSAQEQPVKEMDEAISITEAPGAFKLRLAEVISKNLAKLQPHLPPRTGNPTVSQ